MRAEWKKGSRTRRSTALKILLAESFYRLDADEAADAAFVFEGDDAGDLREQGVITTDADIDAGLELRSALTNQDRTARDQLATEALHAKSLRMTVASVSGAAYAFFMSHE